MRTGLRRHVARVATGTLVATVALSGATAAQAWTLGTNLGGGTISPATGGPDNLLTMSTDGPCTDPSAASAQIFMFGQGFPVGGENVTANNPLGILPTNPAGGYDVPLLNSLTVIGQMEDPPVVYSGTYQLVLACRHGIADVGDYTTSISFSDPGHYQSGGVAAPVTTVSLSATPAGPVTVGSAVTFKAATTPAGATGSVAFQDNLTTISSVKVSADQATFATTALGVGVHSLRAVFTPESPAGALPSTSATVSVTVNALTQPLPAVPAVVHPSALALQVGTELTCPGGRAFSVPAAVGTAVVCPSGGPPIAVGEGARPVALLAPAISGGGRIGTKLTLSPGIWTPKYTSRTVVWKRDGKAIAKASGAFYVVKKTDKGHKISASVTVHLAGHPDGTASTVPTKIKASGQSVLPTTGNLGGVVGDSSPVTVPVGSMIGCIAGELTGATTTSSGWLVDGTSYPAAAAFEIPATLLGHKLVCRTTGTNAGGSIISDAVVNVVTAGPLLSYVAPHIAGTARVGKKLTATAGKWYPRIGQATYTWLRNGTPIKGATKASYALTKADKKHKLSVRVSVTLSGWAAAKAVSAPVSVG